MNKFLKSHLLDAYNFNCDHSQFCNKATDLLQKPFFSFQVSTNKENLPYLNKTIEENEEELTLIFAKKVLPFYGFNPKKVERFYSLELLTEYVSSRITFPMNFESVYAHFVLISVYKQNLEFPDEHLSTFKSQGLNSYMIRSVKTRYHLKNLAKAHNFNLYPITTSPIYSKHSFLEKTLLKVFSFMEKK